MVASRDVAEQIDEPASDSGVKDRAMLDREADIEAWLDDLPPEWAGVWADIQRRHRVKPSAGG